MSEDGGGAGTRVEQGVLEGVPADRRIADLVHDVAPMRDARDLPGLFAGLARSIVRVIHADACLISLVDEDRRVLRDVAASVVPPAHLNVVAEEWVLADFPTTVRVIEDGETFEVSRNDAEADPAEIGFLREMGFERMLICPLRVEQGIIGCVEAYRLQDRPFRSDDAHHVEVLTSFAANSHARIVLQEKLEGHYITTIEALTSALEARDPSTQAHTSRMRDLAVALASALKVPEGVRRSVQLGAVLHDVGKIGIPDAILRKEGPLDSSEWELMRQHPLIGERMLSRVDFLAPALPVVRHHHERWDGEGYPDRLAGEAIPLEARIVAVCDAFDAMTSDRPYRAGRSIEAACEELLAAAGIYHDPMCTSLLVDIVTSLGDGELEDRFIRYSV